MAEKDKEMLRISYCDFEKINQSQSAFFIGNRQEGGENDAKCFE